MLCFNRFLIAASFVFGVAPVRYPGSPRENAKGVPVHGPRLHPFVPVGHNLLFIFALIAAHLIFFRLRPVLVPIGFPRASLY